MCYICFPEQTTRYEETLTGQQYTTDNLPYPVKTGLAWVFVRSQFVCLRAAPVLLQFQFERISLKELLLLGKRSGSPWICFIYPKSQIQTCLTCEVLWNSESVPRLHSRIFYFNCAYDFDNLRSTEIIFWSLVSTFHTQQLQKKVCFISYIIFELGFERFIAKGTHFIFLLCKRQTSTFVHAWSGLCCM